MLNPPRIPPMFKAAKVSHTRTSRHTQLPFPFVPSPPQSWRSAVLSGGREADCVYRANSERRPLIRDVVCASIVKIPHGRERRRLLGTLACCRCIFYESGKAAAKVSDCRANQLYQLFQFLSKPITFFMLTFFPCKP